MTHTILVGARPDAAGRDALALGVDLARLLGAQVDVVGVGPPDGRLPRRSALVGRLEELCADLPADVGLSVDAVTGPSVLEALHDRAVRDRADVLVVGASHRGATGRALRGDLLAELLHRAPCALAVAPPGQATRQAATVGLAWDGSAEADAALEWAIELAGRGERRLRVLGVLEPRHPEGRPLEPEARRRLDAVRETAARRAHTELQVLWGEPVALLAGVSRDLGLLVLGSHAPGALSRALHGSVSIEVVRRAACAVLLVAHGVRAPFAALAP
ncbi:MAG TPA: universal stress protein [Baekduia sp.]|nr:universal stress protein [Baekduia sp.]